jgi:hypothetical protein
MYKSICSVPFYYLLLFYFQLLLVVNKLMLDIVVSEGFLCAKSNCVHTGDCVQLCITAQCACTRERERREAVYH